WQRAGAGPRVPQGVARATRQRLASKPEEAPPKRVARKWISRRMTKLVLSGQVGRNVSGQRAHLCGDLIWLYVRRPALQHWAPERLRHLSPQRVISDLECEDCTLAGQCGANHFRVAPQRTQFEQLAGLRRKADSEKMRCFAGVLLDECDEFGIGRRHLLGTEHRRRRHTETGRKVAPAGRHLLEGPGARSGELPNDGVPTETHAQKPCTYPGITAAAGSRGHIGRFAGTQDTRNGSGYRSR